MTEETRMDSRKQLLMVLFILLAAIVFGLIWFFFLSGAPSSESGGVGWYLFSFAAGLTMIVLPCTLPLAFVIVPLSMGKGPLKGFTIALFFGIGVAITLSLYGVLAAILGKVAIGTLGAPLETVKNWMYFIAGLFAYLFALGQLGFVNFKMPSYSGALPGFIQKQQDIFKALLLGLFLGNIGVGCPHPATPVILTQIAASGNVLYGWLLFLVHAIGRILPLLFLAILGILGVNALAGLVKRKDAIERATGWGMVFVAAFILILGLFSHDWWVNSGIHSYLEELTQEERFLTIIGARSGAAAAHGHGLIPADHTGLFGLPLSLGTWALLFLWTLPFFWHYCKRKKEAASITDATEKAVSAKVLPQMFWNFVTLSLLLILVFGYVLPRRFAEKAKMMDHDEGAVIQEEMGARGHEGMTAEEMAKHMEEEGMAGERATEHMEMENGAGVDHVDHGESLYHEEGDVKKGLAVTMNFSPAPAATAKKTRLIFYVSEKPAGTPVTNLEIEHEKFIHVIGVRDDLNEFFHIHPQPLTDGKGVAKPGFWFADYEFLKPGAYKVWSDVTRGGATHSFGHIPFSVDGEGERSNKQIDIVTNTIVENYQVAVKYDEPIARGMESDVSFEVKDLLGNPVEVEPFLAAGMHLAVIKDDLKAFIHTHPESAGHSHAALPSIIEKTFAHGGVADENVKPETINFHVNFPSAGNYRLFAQFRPKGIDLPPEQSLVAAFDVRAEDVKPFAVSKWWRNLLVSLLGILLLSWAVKKYITVKEAPKI